MKYNLVCFASRKPIKPYEECILIPIASRLGRDFFEISNHVDEKALATNMTVLNGYSTMYWTYFSTPFKVRYDGSSGFKFEKSSESIRLLKNFLKNIGDLGWNSQCDYRTSTVNVNINDYKNIDGLDDEQLIMLFEKTQMAIKQSRLFAENYGKPSAISFAVVSLKAYHALSKIVTYSVDGMETKMINAIKEMYESKKTESNIEQFLKVYVKQEIEKGDHPIYASYGTDNHNCVKIVDDIDKFCQLVKDEQWFDVEKLLKKGLSRKQRFMQFNHALNKLNLKIQPIETDDSNSNSFEEYKLFIGNL